MQKTQDLRKSFKALGCELIGYSSEVSKLIENVKCPELEKGERHQRILIERRFFDTATKTYFAVLGSHFDHLSLISRQKSLEQELNIVAKDGICRNAC